ncbi:MAG TPA: hypothetical protein VM324_04595 [Egibacteraceae bacterium]|nr:hypothetical protein [Egibacteraceae bacterium]
MPGFILLTIIIVIVVLVAKSIHDARQGEHPSTPAPPPATRRRPARWGAGRPSR